MQLMKQSKQVSMGLWADTNTVYCGRMNTCRLAVRSTRLATNSQSPTSTTCPSHSCESWSVAWCEGGTEGGDTLTTAWVFALFGEPGGERKASAASAAGERRGCPDSSFGPRRAGHLMPTGEILMAQAGRIVAELQSNCDPFACRPAAVMVSPREQACTPSRRIRAVDSLRSRYSLPVPFGHGSRRVSGCRGACRFRPPGRYHPRRSPDSKPAPNGARNHRSGRDRHPSPEKKRQWCRQLADAPRGMRGNPVRDPGSGRTPLRSLAEVRGCR